MTAKKFNFGLYQQYDKDAKEAVIAHLGHCCRENDDRYGVDLIYRGQLIEVEVKMAFGYGPFPFDTIQIPYRKAKFVEQGAKFMVLNRYLTQAVVIPNKAFTRNRLKEVPNKYVESGERFFCIPVNECKIIQLERQ